MQLDHITLVDYSGKTLVCVPHEKDIESIFIKIVTGDEIATVIYTDGDTSTYDSGRTTRLHDFYDGAYILAPQDFAEHERILDALVKEKASCISYEIASQLCGSL